MNRDPYEIVGQMYDLIEADEHVTQLGISRRIGGTSALTIRAFAKVLSQLGVLEMQVGFQSGRKGQQTTWKLHTNKVDGLRKFKGWLDQNRDMTVRQMAQLDQPVVAVGDERPNPMERLRPAKKDEAGALIEAARQYHSNRAFLAEKRKEFEARDLELPEIELPHDERLEAISLVLEHVDRLQRTNERLEKQLREEYRVPQKILAEAKATIERQREQIKRLVTEKAKPENGADSHEVHAT